MGSKPQWGLDISHVHEVLPLSEVRERKNPHWMWAVWNLRPLAQKLFLKPPDFVIKALFQTNFFLCDTSHEIFENNCTFIVLFSWKVCVTIFILLWTSKSCNSIELCEHNYCNCVVMFHIFIYTWSAFSYQERKESYRSIADCHWKVMEWVQV